MTRRTLRGAAATLGLLAFSACTSDSPTTAFGPSSRTPARSVTVDAALESIRINEVESNGGVPGDWVELINLSANPIDISGFILKDDNNSRNFALPSGTVVPAGGYLVLDENVQFFFGLGAPDMARLYGPDGTTLIDSYTWTAHAGTTYARCPNGTGAFVTATSSTKGAANNCGTGAPTVVINEVESSGGSPGDWVELHNHGPNAIDLSGYVFRDDDNSHTYVIPSGTSIAAGGYLVIEEAQMGFGLGQPDMARLFAPGGTTLVDSYSWTSHASTTNGRCPNGTGSFATTTSPTKGSANACAGDIVYSPWPGAATITAADPGSVFTSNLSGLTYQRITGSSTGIVWAVRNGPGTLYRLTWTNNVWTPKATRTWANGKALRYPNGTGDVDAEGVVAIGNAIYVASERNNSTSGTSRNSILRYDVSVENGAVLVATHEWNITSDIPANGANLGLEAITFVPDAFLVANGFIDDSKGGPYNPANYPNHTDGLFFVGVEATGMVHAYALDHSAGTFTRITSFGSGFNGVMDLTFDTELGNLWAICDNTCNGRSHVLRLDTQAGSPTRGRFAITGRFERPVGMPNLNNEGFAFAPLAECVGGTRQVLWADDSETGGFSIRRGTVTCSAF